MNYNRFMSELKSFSEAPLKMAWVLTYHMHTGAFPAHEYFLNLRDLLDYLRSPSMQDKRITISIGFFTGASEDPELEYPLTPMKGSKVTTQEWLASISKNSINGLVLSVKTARFIQYLRQERSPFLLCWNGDLEKPQRMRWGFSISKSFSSRYYSPRSCDYISRESDLSRD